MFGYVRPAADRLTQEQTDLFRQRLLRPVPHAGTAVRPAGPDDFELRSGLSGHPCWTAAAAFPALAIAARCIPSGAAPAGENPALDAAADLSVILTWWQLRDGVTDHGFFGGLKYRLAALLLRRSYRKAARLRPDFDRLVQGCLGELAELGRRIVPPLTARRIPSPGCWPVRQRRSRILSGGGCWRSCCTIWAAGYT